MSLIGFITRKIKKSYRQRKQARKVSKAATKGIKLDKQTKKLSYQAALKNIKVGEKKKTKKQSFKKVIKKAFKKARKKGRRNSKPLINVNKLW